MNADQKQIDFLALRAPFPPDRISWRVGATKADRSQGLGLAYIDARDVMHRLDEVCGPLWQCEYTSMTNGTCCCRIGIKLGSEWIWRSNGALNVADSDKPDAQEMAEKGSYSDAFKRAAVLFGIGQYLYDLDNVWVNLKPQGKSHVIDPQEMPKLAAALKKAASHIAPPPKPAPVVPHTETPEQTAARLAAQHEMLTGATADSPTAKCRELLTKEEDFAAIVKLVSGMFKRIDQQAEGWTNGAVGSLLQFAGMRLADTAKTLDELQAGETLIAARLDKVAQAYVVERFNKRADVLAQPQHA